MSQAAPPSDKAGKKASSSPVPPDERFWQRYSPHAELPLSSAGSFVTHILVFGLLLLASFLSTLLFNRDRSLPVEAVVVSGGGGSPKGQNDGPNTGGEPVEDQPQSNEKQEMVPPDEVPPPQINIQPDTTTKPNFDDSQRRIQQDESATRALENLRRRTAAIQSPGNTPKGRGGSGTGGGLGSGTGTGVGAGRGAGNLTPTQREKRTLRWSMLFNTPDSDSYISQLRGLGAILAIPVREDANGIEYKIVRDLSARPAKFTNDDIRNIMSERLVRWIDENPQSVRGVMSVLRLKGSPTHFFAFMPVELEQKLLKLELDYLHKRYSSRQEDDITMTRFRIHFRNGKYEPEVADQKFDK